jgi:hypothetical protein
LERQAEMTGDLKNAIGLCLGADDQEAVLDAPCKPGLIQKQGHRRPERNSLQVDLDQRLEVLPHVGIHVDR